jgi:hypothetical protein
LRIYARKSHKLIFVLQTNWSKALGPVLEWTIICGKDVPEVVKQMETQGKVLPGAFKLLESIYVPDDWRELTLLLKDTTKKATVKRMQDEAKKIIRRRYWNWILFHPDLGAGEIHKSRSMHLLEILLCTKFLSKKLEFFTINQHLNR